MNIQQFQEALFTKGREIGYADMEIYYVNGRSTSVKVLKGEIDQYTIVENGGLSFRGVINGKMGYASTEKLEPDVIDFLLEEARSNADILKARSRMSCSQALRVTLSSLLMPQRWLTRLLRF